MAYLTALILDRLDKLVAQEKVEIAIENPEKLDLDAIVVSMSQSVILLQEVANVLTEALLELKQLRLGMSMALEEDLSTVLEQSGASVAVPFE